MSNITVGFLFLALLMLAFLFVDATSGRYRNLTVMKIEFIVLIVALIAAVLSHVIGGV